MNPVYGIGLFVKMAVKETTWFFCLIFAGYCRLCSCKSSGEKALDGFLLAFHCSYGLELP